MKDAVVNLLVFLLVFIVVALVFLTNYGLALVLVPGGKGLIFSNPLAAALIPSLLVGLLAAQYRSVHRPGWFAVTWGLQALAFFLLLTLSIPSIQQLPSVRPSDATPLTPQRFLPLADGSLLLGTEAPATILIPVDKSPMTVSPMTQYDPVNQRFVFADQPPKSLGSTGPEREYFEYTPAIASLQSDLLALYSTLRDNWSRHPLVFWFQAAAITWFFLGFYFFFSFKTWPVVQVLLAVFLVRLGLIFVVYAFWTMPALVDLWVGAQAEWLRQWSPICLVGVAAAALFFMTILTKPHRQEALR